MNDNPQPQISSAPAPDVAVGPLNPDEAAIQEIKRPVPSNAELLMLAEQFPPPPKWLEEEEERPF
jgi:hypothetical protein